MGVAQSEVYAIWDTANFRTLGYSPLQVLASSCLPKQILKVHLTPKFLFGRDETVQLSHKEFANFISMWYF